MRQERLFNSKESFWSLMQHMISIIDSEEMEDYLSGAIELTIGYRIEDLELEYCIVIEDGKLYLLDHLSKEVDLLISVSSSDFHGITSGKINAIHALVTKKMKFEKGSWDDMLIIGGLPIKKYYLQACRDFKIEA